MSDLLFFLEKIHWPYPQGKQMMNSPAASRAPVLATGRWQARVRRWTFALSVLCFHIPKGDDLETEQNSTLWLLISLFVLQIFIEHISHDRQKLAQTPNCHTFEANTLVYMERLGKEDETREGIVQPVSPGLTLRHWRCKWSPGSFSTH